MRPVRLSLQRALCAALLAAVGIGSGLAHGFPNRPLRFVLPFGPGSGTDIFARIVTDDVRVSMGTSVVVGNRAGGSGQIAAEIAARAASDGYALLLSTNTPHSANPFLFRKLNYDPDKDFAAVARLIHYVSVLAVGPSVGVWTVPEMIARVKSTPGKTSYAFGNSTGQVNGAHFAAAAKLDSVPVPYKSTVPAMSDKRSSLLPELPAVGDTEPGFDIVSWAGVFFPSGPPAPIAERLSAELLKSMAKPAFGQRLAEMGLEPAPSGPEDLTRFVSEQRIWRATIRAAGIQPE